MTYDSKSLSELVQRVREGSANELVEKTKIAAPQETPVFATTTTRPRAGSLVGVDSIFAPPPALSAPPPLGAPPPLHSVATHSSAAKSVSKARTLRDRSGGRRGTPRGLRRS